MKIFKDLTDKPNRFLLRIIQKFPIAFFGLGLMTGMTIVLAGVASKRDDFEEVLMLSGIAIFFVLISMFLNVFVRNRLSPEIRKRLNEEQRKVDKP